MQRNTYLYIGIMLLALGACKNNTQSTQAADSTTNDSAPSAPAMVQHNFPETPVRDSKDTTFKINGKTYGVKLQKNTVDTSLVVFTRKAMGKMIKDVYYDFEYFLTPKGPDYKGGEIKVTKHNFREEFNDDFFNYAVLYDMNFEGYNEVNKEYEFTFMINKPDTENTFKIYFFINNKGETHYEVEDIVA